MEYVAPPGRWASDYRPFMMSAATGSDLLQAASWRSSNRVALDKSWLNREFVGWLEGNAVAGVDGSIANVLRVHYYNWIGARAAIIRVGSDGKRASFEPDRGFVRLPGGAKKFTIRFDPKSKRYWSLTNGMPRRHRKDGRLHHGGNPERTRNTLTLVSSPDLRTWKVRTIVLYHPDAIRHGFQYADWQFLGNDIVAVIRTAFDDDVGGAHLAHDANYLTFHRIPNFRQQPSADGPFDELLREFD